MNDVDANINLTIDSPADEHRLSPQQAHLWALHQAGSAAYICCDVEIDGLLDPMRLQLALSNVCEAHAVLRSKLVHHANALVPLQAPGNGVAWSETLDFARLSPAEQATQLNELWTAQTTFRHDWATSSALVAQLVRISESKSHLILSLSPMFGDGYTVGPLIRAVAHAYGSSPDQTCLPSEGLDYSQFADWQNELRETKDVGLQEAMNYWSTQPAGLKVSGLPTRDNPGLPGSVPNLISMIVGDDILKAISAGAARCNVTENEFLFATWSAFLWRWTKFNRASIGFLSDGRPFEELQEVMGLVSRWVPIGLEVTGASSFRSVCAEMQACLASALEWQDYFLFAATSNTDADAFPTPDFGFSYEEQFPTQTCGESRWTVCRKEVVLEPHSLHLVCTRENDTLRAELVYDTSLFDQAIAHRLLHEWVVLARDAAAHPDQSIDRLQVLNDDESTELLVRLNDTATPFPEMQCFHELFEEQVRRTPDAVAVRFGSDAITYLELNEQADILAANLREYGVGPEGLVAICLSRSTEMIVAILGVLKAGGAYVPLDASYPLDRIAWILEDSTPVLVLTTTDLYDRLPGSSIPVFCLDESSGHAYIPETGPLMRAAPHNLAYIIYTSGSTGWPKGVMVPHRGLVNYLHWCSSAYRLSAGNGTLVDTPIGFDLTITSLLAPLIVGQTAVLVPETKGIESLADALRTEGDISLVKTTPAHMEILRNLLPEAAAGASHLFVIGGEALRGESLSFWRAHAPETRLINEYGPTETVVGCCTYDVPQGKCFGGSVPIGRPIANTRLYILDDHLHPVPIGMQGELYIGGAGVVRGYLNRPDLTAERFIPDAFAAEPGCRLYRTGDVCKYLEDGNIEYLGRTDGQVKIRGFRIELGEIENVLLMQAGVREAVVLARQDSPGDKRLVAYVVTEDATIDNGELRERLQDRLPEYMVPGAFVLLPRLPLTPNGKVDREALPAPEKDALQHDVVEPRNAVEQVLAGIWGDLLGYEQIDVHQDFFGLGGHSLLATQAISYVRETFQVEVPLLALFQAPSVAAFAELMLRDPNTRPQIESVANLLVSLGELSEEELEERLRHLDANPDTR